jgi:diguanylate cyclase (GGDEF)-like protein
MGATQAGAGASPLVDALTGALSRGALEAALQHAVEEARLAGRPFAVFLLDVDWFKSINDVYGHARGDAVLRGVVDRLRRQVRPGDQLFRYGGDEFVVLLADTGAGAAATLARELVAAVGERPFEGTPPLALSISLGVACLPEDGDTPVALLEVADRRNYLAKRGGRGRAVDGESVPDLPPAATLTRLLDREAELATVLEFLDRLRAARHGLLSVTGPPSSGRSRFLVEIAGMARLRGFVVLCDEPLDGQPAMPEVAGPGVLPGDTGCALRRQFGRAAGLLILVDGDKPFPDVPAEAPPGLCVGYVRASEQPAPPAEPGGALARQVLMRPLSRSGLRILLRLRLPGEPAEQLLDWFAGATVGLPGLVERELNRLSRSGGLVRHGDGFWTLGAVHTVAGPPARAGRLPAPVTPFVGRAAEIEQLTRMLAGRRLITLTGAAGIGKTRLSIEVAARCAGDFPDGVFFVGLADIAAPDQLVPAVARAMGTAEKRGQPLLETVCGALAARRALLVLDNFEHLVPAAAVVADLLRAGRTVKIVVTSRERLKLYGEQVYPVPPLSVPDLDLLPERGPELVEAVAHASAVALFVQHAQAAAFDFVLDERNARAVAELCRRLDGLPLAIELAAARCDRSSPVDLLAELGHRLDALADTSIDRTDRHRTLRAAVDWSFHQLDTDDKVLFARLGVFVGGFSLEAAEAVMARGSTRWLRAHLGVLADRSFLSPQTGRGGERRWRMLETIRAYALEHLDRLGARTDAHRRHLAWYVSLAEAAQPALRGSDQDAWLARLETEYADLHAALTFGLEHGETAQAAGIAARIWRFWRVRGYLTEGRQWLERCLAEARIPAPLRIEAHLGAGALALLQADTAAAHWHLETARDAALAAGDLHSAAIAYNLLGALANVEANYPESLHNHERSLAIGQQLGDPMEIAMAMANLGEVASLSGDLVRARQLTEAALPTARRYGASRPMLIILINLGNIARREGNLAGARRCLLEALPLARDLGDRYLLAWVLVSLGLVAVRDGDPHGEALLRGGLLLRRDLGDREGMATALEGFAALHAPARPDRAAFLIGAAETLRTSSGAPIPPADRPGYADLVDALRAGSPEGFTAHRQAGAHTPLPAVLSGISAGIELAEQAVAAALDALP